MSTRLPTRRRKYHLITSPTKGLDVSKQGYEIDEEATPNCHEVSFKRGIIFRSVGWSVFGNSDVAVPLPCSVSIPLFRSRELVGSVDVGALHWDLLSKVEVKCGSSKSILASVTPTNIPLTKSLVSRVVCLSEGSGSLAMRILIRKSATSSGACTVTVTR